MTHHRCTLREEFCKLSLRSIASWKCSTTSLRLTRQQHGLKSFKQRQSEEAQDYVREAKSTEYEEEEERTFVPSAVSVPLKPLFRCDNQCSEKTQLLAAGVGGAE